MKRLSANLRTLAFSMLLTTHSALGAESVAVRLSPAHQTVQIGNGPRFLVTVESVSLTRMLRLDARSDLRDNYARLRVTHDNVPVDVPTLISDPGPISANDYAELSSGENMSFAHDGLPQLLSKLPPGNYSASVGVRTDWDVPAVESNGVTFEIVGR